MFMTMDHDRDEVSGTESSSSLSDVTPEVKREKSSRKMKLSWFQRLILQKEPWILHLNNYALEFIIVKIHLIMFLILASYRLFTTVDDKPTFSIAATFLYVISFTLMWLVIPEGPPFLATPNGVPIFKTIPMKSEADGFKQLLKR